MILLLNDLIVRYAIIIYKYIYIQSYNIYNHWTFQKGRFWVLTLVFAKCWDLTTIIFQISWFLGKYTTRWWFQPNLRNIGQIGSFPKIGMKITTNHLKPPATSLVKMVVLLVAFTWGVFSGDVYVIFSRIYPGFCAIQPIPYNPSICLVVFLPTI